MSNRSSTLEGYFALPVFAFAFVAGITAIVDVVAATPIVVNVLKFSPAVDEAIFSFALQLAVALHLVALLIQLPFSVFKKDVLTNALRMQLLTTFGCAAFLYLLAWVGPSIPLVTHVTLLAAMVTAAVLFVLEDRLLFRSAGKKERAMIRQNGGTATDAAPTPARTLVPSITLADIFGNDQIKARLKDAAKSIVAPTAKPGAVTGSAQPRNGILLFGEPGNGKTVFAEALAGELKLPLLQLSHSDVASKWIGERTTHIKHAFDQAIKAAPCVFFIDEIDSFLESRDGANEGNKEDRDVVNALLTMLVDMRRHKVILMAATNHMDRLDGAGIREGRFDFKVEITPPDAAARVGLLTSGLNKNLPAVAVDKEVIESVARRWNGFSVKRILAVTEELPSYLSQNGKASASTLTYEDIMGALRAIQGRRGVVPENVKPLGDLLLSPATKGMIEQITGRLQDPEYTERHGGTLPTGVLFYGPPGTGKTATAKALAHEIQWGFLPVTGADMARDPKQLEKTYAKAKEIRPCLIFIDEADELLKSREYSPSTEATNKLLTLMDGVSDRVKDVVWIAATNNPEMIDPALLRSGRFTEKVVFELPSASQLALHVGRWIADRKVQLADGLLVADAVAIIGTQSIANAEGILQAALNRAISRRGNTMAVNREDLTTALQSVMG